MYETIETERRGAVGVIRLNQPGTLNALSVRMVDEIAAALDELVPASRAILMTSAGRAFCSGANLTGGMVENPPKAERDAGRVLETHINPLMTRLRDLSVPWITAVRGAAAGAGCSLALAGDLIVAGESAYFLQAFVRIGLVPDAGSSHLVARAVGRVRAMEMMLLGERIPAAQALEWGLINRVVADEALDAEAMALAERLASGPTKTLGHIRQLVWSALDEPWTQALDTERQTQRKVGGTRDAGEGIAAFVEKRPAAFTGA